MAAQLHDGLFPDFRVLGKLCEIESVEGQAGSFRPLVVAGHTVLIDQSLLLTDRCWTAGSCRVSLRLCGSQPRSPRQSGESQGGCSDNVMLHSHPLHDAIGFSPKLTHVIPEARIDVGDKLLWIAPFRIKLFG